MRITVIRKRSDFTTASHEKVADEEEKDRIGLGRRRAKGLCHIAFLKTLDKMGLKPSVIAGAKKHHRAGILPRCGDHARGQE